MIGQQRWKPDSFLSTMKQTSCKQTCTIFFWKSPSQPMIHMFKNINYGNKSY